MAELAIRGGAPVRPHGYPEWPVHDERDVEAVAEVVRGGRWGGFPCLLYTSPSPRDISGSRMPSSA